MVHPDIELKEEHETKFALKPCKPFTHQQKKLSNKGITNRVITKIMQQLFMDTKGAV